MTYYDLNADGFIDAVDANGDGYVDAVDTNADGYIDTVDTNADGYLDAVDTNGDGYLDAFDTDLDGLVDTYDVDGDGYADVPASGGVVGSVDSPYTPDEVAAGYSSTDSSLVEPSRFADDNSLISDNDTSSNL